MQPDEVLSARELEAEFPDTTLRVPLRAAYRLGLVLVAAATITLVLVYLGLILAVTGAVLYHAIFNSFIITEPGGGLLSKGLIYGGPLVVGGVLVFFLTKPLFARRPPSPPSLQLTPEEAPVLHQLIEQIRRTLGAPRPRLVRVDCAVNASASYGGGALGWLSGNLVLTIGLPLLHGMSARQLAGILAHELGHFAQGSSMRLTYLIRGINGWFARVVFERDAWDQRLEKAARETDLRVGIVLHVARFFVWLTRQILRGLMLMGHAIGMFMLRQMEYDADRYEARLAGSDVFAATAGRIRLLGAGQAVALARLEEGWSRRCICDDLPALAAAMVPRLPAAVKTAVEDPNADAKKPGVFDTHPPDRARIASAEREAAPGIFRLERPAGAFLPDLLGLSRRVTEHHYREVLELPLEVRHLVSLGAFLEEVDDRDQADAAAREFFGDFFSAFHPLEVPPALPPPPASLAEVAAKVQASRETLGRLQEVAAATPAEKKESVLVEPSGFADAAAAARARLGATLSLIDGGTSEAERKTAEELLRVLTALGALGPRLRQLGAAAKDAIARLDAHFEDPQHGNTRRQAVDALAAVHAQLRQIETELEAVPFPFRHGFDGFSVRAYVTADLPEVDPHDLGVIPRIQRVAERLSALYGLVLEKLARIALSLEHARL
jgi:Zn-dependent protease with chaperone function